MSTYSELVKFALKYPGAQVSVPEMFIPEFKAEAKKVGLVVVRQAEDVRDEPSFRFRKMPKK